MRFGLDLPNFGDFADVRLVAEIASTAEENGWDGVFLWDHIARSTAFPPGLPFARRHRCTDRDRARHRTGAVWHARHAAASTPASQSGA